MSAFTPITAAPSTDIEARVAQMHAEYARRPAYLRRDLETEMRKLDRLCPPRVQLATEPMPETAAAFDRINQEFGK